MRKLAIWCWLGLWVSSAEAQSPIRADGPLRIVAVMADFQPQENRFTSGNGSFDLPFLNRIPVTIDPLPHDRGYFEAHLEFVKRYFERESSGAVQISYEVLPTVYRLPNPMAHYSPTGQSDSANYRLAWLARDTWAAVRSSGALDGRAFDTDRTLFVIFHAGVGRDLELTGTTLEKTPQDIPSVYLNSESIGRLLGDSFFTGFPINDLGVTVSETAILPQTNSRPGKDVTGAEFVLELSINGLSAAMMGNFMGLPDLYNTESGASGIGRFGLMDGAGFFAYNGLFPPSLSAWERIRLGWATPFDIDLDDAAPIDLPLGAIARHRPTLNETILIENRHRDPTGNGVTLTIRSPSGSIQSISIPRNEDRFNAFDFRKIDEILPAGTLIDVSHPDWALPGGPDIGLDGIENTADDRFLAGGFLIWRINENIVRDHLPTNRINADPARRGIELIEADGARDIGRPSGTLTSYDQGAPFDFWWNGNNFTVITTSGQRLTVYQNRWGDDTQPSNRSASGARADFEFYGFSDNQPDGFFRARRAGSAAVTAAPPIRLSGTSTFYQSSFQYRDGYPLHITSVGNRILVPTPTGFHLADSTAGTAVFEGSAGNNLHQPLVTGTRVITALLGSGTGPNRAYQVLPDGTLTQEWSASPGGTIGYLQVSDGRVVAPHTPHRHRLTDGGYEPSSQIGQVSDDGSVILRSDGLFTSSGSLIRSLDCPSSFNRLHLHTFRNAGPEPDPAYWVLCQNNIVRISGDRSTDITLGTSIDFPQFASFGPADETVLYVDRESGHLIARNETGAIRNGFPVQPRPGFRFIGTPLVWDVDGDGRDDILVSAHDGYDMVITAWTSDGLALALFPLRIGSAPVGPSLPILPHVRNGVLTAVSADGELRQWHLPNADVSRTSTAVRSSTNRLPGSAAPSRLLVLEETYNWPNPASDATHIRFQTRTSAAVSIVVITLDGRTIWSEQLTAESDVPQERRIDTSGWANGVYFARVRVSHDGRSEQKLVKIAVAR